MRNYAQIAPTFWTRGSGKKIRGDKNAQIVALYLMSSPATSMVGIFHLAIPTLCHETGLSEPDARAGLERCEREEIAFWDEEDELIWIPALARYQLGDELKHGKGGKADHRIKGVERALAPYRNHRFHALFVERYGGAYGIAQSPSEGASKGLADVAKGLPSPYVPDPASAPDHVPDPEPKPETPEVANDPRPATQAPPEHARIPKSLADAMRLPIEWRARALVSQPLNAQWANPQEWPENIAALRAFEAATGVKRGFDGPTDPALLVIARLYSAERPVEAVAAGIKAIVESKWWTKDGAKRGLTSITTEVFSRYEVAAKAERERAESEEASGVHPKAAARLAAQDAARERRQRELAAEAETLPAGRTVRALTAGIGGK